MLLFLKYILCSTKMTRTYKGSSDLSYNKVCKMEFSSPICDVVNPHKQEKKLFTVRYIQKFVTKQLKDYKKGFNQKTEQNTNQSTKREKLKKIFTRYNYNCEWVESFANNLIIALSKIKKTKKICTMIKMNIKELSLMINNTHFEEFQLKPYIDPKQKINNLQKKTPLCIIEINKNNLKTLIEKFFKKRNKINKYYENLENDIQSIQNKFLECYAIKKNKIVIRHNNKQFQKYKKNIEMQYRIIEEKMNEFNRYLIMCNGFIDTYNKTFIELPNHSFFNYQ